MKKKLIIIIYLSLLFINNALASFDIKAKTAILQDYLSGKFLIK